MKACKKISFVISIILLIALVLLYIVFSIFSHINFTKNLYNGISYSFDSVFKNLQESFKEFESIKSSSYTLTLSSENISSLPFSGITLSNNSKNKYYEISLRDFNIKNKSKIDVSTFATKDKVGFYLSTDPQIYYTANSNKFRTKWNNSIYGNLIKIPKFIPDDVNYNKVSSMVSAKNICKLFLGMGIGKEKIDYKEIINHISVSEPKSYIIWQNQKKTEAQIVHLSISKSHMETVTEKLINSSENAKFDYINTLSKDMRAFLNTSSQNELNINFVVLQNKLLWAETSVKVSDGLINARLDINDNDFNFTVKKLSASKISKPVFMLKLISKPNPNISVQVNKKNKELCAFNLEVKKNNSIESRFLYYGKNAELHTVNAVYLPKSKSLRANIPTKNIYTLSVSDLIKLSTVIIGECEAFIS